MASSTAQLLVSCKVKADPDSASTKRLLVKITNIIFSKLRATYKSLAFYGEKWLLKNSIIYIIWSKPYFWDNDIPVFQNIGKQKNNKSIAVVVGLKNVKKKWFRSLDCKINLFKNRFKYSFLQYTNANSLFWFYSLCFNEFCNCETPNNGNDMTTICIPNT